MTKNWMAQLATSEYDFLRMNEHLGNHVMLLGISGSHAYGTNVEGSDVDLRGIALNRKSDLLGMTTFEQYVDPKTDTCIYSFNKMVSLLLNCNPNTIELLGLNPEHYLYLNEIGKELLNQKHLFLSRRAIQSFGGYATAQLRRLQNALARDSYPQAEKEQHMYHSVRNAMCDFNNRYTSFEEGAMRLSIDKSEREDMETEIFVDVSLKHYPLRDYKNMWSEMQGIVKEYEKVGKRTKAKDEEHLNKHAMHLVRLYLMAIDILEKEEINTYRENERELLLRIRLGEFQKEDGTFRAEFYDMVREYEKRFDYAKRHTALPEQPDRNKVEEFVMSVNERAIRW